MFIAVPDCLLHRVERCHCLIFLRDRILDVFYHYIINTSSSLHVDFAYPHLLFHLPFLILLSHHGASGAKIPEGQFKSLCKQIILTKFVAVTLSVYCIDDYPEADISKNPSFTECSTKCLPWWHEHSYLKEQAYILRSTAVASAVRPVIS